MPSASNNPEMHFQRLQREFARHLRAPQLAVAPPGIEERRLGIYRELVYNNIESFIAGGFPVVRSLYNDDDWHAMVGDFVHRHACRSPYFLQIGEEFLTYLQRERQARACDPPFLLELAHYEWVELALDISTEEFPADVVQAGDVLSGIPVVSPLVWSLCYRYPVHRIGPNCQPREAPAAPTFLLVYRDRADEVGFMEVNALTARLLQLAQSGSVSGRALLQTLAGELHYDDTEQLVTFGRELLQKLLAAGVVAGLRL